MPLVPQVIVTSENEITIVTVGLQGPAGVGGGGGAGLFEMSFTDVALTVGSALNVVHGLNRTPASVMVWNASGEQVFPDRIEEITPNAIALWFESFRPLQGTWSVTVL